MSSTSNISPRSRTHKYQFAGSVWIYPGLGGWHFVTLDKALSADIKAVAHTYGAGFVRVRATIGETSWETALFPHSASKAYLLSIKQSVRKKESILAGDDVVVEVVLLSK